MYQFVCTCARTLLDWLKSRYSRDRAESVVVGCDTRVVSSRIVYTIVTSRMVKTNGCTRAIVYGALGDRRKYKHMGASNEHVMFVHNVMSNLTASCPGYVPTAFVKTLYGSFLSAHGTMLT